MRRRIGIAAAIAALLACGSLAKAATIQDSGLPAITERALVGGLAILVTHRLDTGRADELPAHTRFVDPFSFVRPPLWNGKNDAK